MMIIAKNTNCKIALSQYAVLGISKLLYIQYDNYTSVSRYYQHTAQC